MAKKAADDAAENARKTSETAITTKIWYDKMAKKSK